MKDTNYAVKNLRDINYFILKMLAYRFKKYY